jgi:hypothetical protein
VVSDPRAKAARWRERAEECRKLARTANSEKVRAHYRQLAGTYLKMARTELRAGPSAKPSRDPKEEAGHPASHEPLEDKS